MHALTRPEFGHNADLLFGMHRLRRRVFKDRLDWTVSVAGDLEIDHYDTLGPTYLLIVTHRQVIGSVRMLPTTGMNMLASTFALLLDGAAAPSSSNIWESSRFCVDTQATAEISEAGLRKATFMLFAAMIEWGLEHDLASIATVTDLRMERILRRAGWSIERLGEPKVIGTTRALAGLLPISGDALARIYDIGSISGPVLEVLNHMALVA